MINSHRRSSVLQSVVERTPCCTNVVIPSNAHTTYPSTGTAICSQMGTCLPTRRLYGIDISLERHMAMESVCAKRVKFSTMFSGFPNFEFSLTCGAQRTEKRTRSRKRGPCVSLRCGVAEGSHQTRADITAWIRRVLRGEESPSRPGGVHRVGAVPTKVPAAEGVRTKPIIRAASPLVSARNI